MQRTKQLIQDISRGVDTSNQLFVSTEVLLDTREARSVERGTPEPPPEEPESPPPPEQADNKAAGTSIPDAFLKNSLLVSPILFSRDIL